MSARRALLLIWPILPGLTAASVARAREPPTLNLAVDSQCPSRELIESQLAPLLREDAPELDPSASIEIVDAGESYRIRVGAAERQVQDPWRDCQERAKVSAVFIALNLPTLPSKPQPRLPPQAPPQPSSQPELPTEPVPHTQLALQLLGAVEHAPELSRAGKGLYVAASLRRGPFELTVTSGVLAPLGIVAAGEEAVSYELWRLPTSVTVGFSTDGRVLRWGAAGGLALDVLRFRGVDLANPDSGLRLNPGFALALPLRLHASRHIAAILIPTLAVFPRNYLLRIEPSRQVDESPRFWLGARIGLEISVLGG